MLEEEEDEAQGSCPRVAPQQPTTHPDEEPPLPPVAHLSSTSLPHLVALLSQTARLLLLLHLLPAGLASASLPPEQGSYTAEHCWQGGANCDLVHVVLLPPSPHTSPTAHTAPLAFPNSSMSAAQFPSQPQYVFEGLGLMFHLTISPDALFVPPRLEELGTPSYVLEEDSTIPGAACFFSGHLVGKPESSVAVSLCKGMVSGREQEGEDIQPLFPLVCGNV